MVSYNKNKAEASVLAPVKFDAESGQIIDKFTKNPLIIKEICGFEIF